MTGVVKNSIVFACIVFFSACNHFNHTAANKRNNPLFTYTPRSKKNIQREKPSVILLNRIIEYREEFNGWPYSKEGFISKGKKYFDAFNGFPYLGMQFKVISDDKMIFYFFDHVKDNKNMNESGMIELHSYHGKVYFYKSNNKFIWKLKMH
jgi:hypothetical protein